MEPSEPKQLGSHENQCYPLRPDPPPIPTLQVTFMLLDQNNREHAIDAFRPDLSSASFQRPQSETNVASGCPLFFPLSKLQSPKHAYVKDDTMFLKCIVDTSA